MEQHRANPACASCHAQMDPLGFALENFDAIGKLAHAHRGVRADRRVGRAAERRDVRRRQRAAEGAAATSPSGFVATLTEKLLTYGARPRPRVLRHARGPADRARRGAGRITRWSSLVVGRRQERAVSDEESGSHDHHEESAAAADVSARHGRDASRCRCSTRWCPALTAQAGRAAASDPAHGIHLHRRTARTCRSGRRTARAPTSRCRRFCRRWRRFATRSLVLTGLAQKHGRIARRRRRRPRARRRRLADRRPPQEDRGRRRAVRRERWIRSRPRSSARTTALPSLELALEQSEASSARATPATAASTRTRSAGKTK